MYQFRTLADAEQALEKFLPSLLPRQAYTLDHVLTFMDYLGNPQNTVKAIHLAGTSGKTSTAYYIAALLGQSGKKVGLLTSPHIAKITERVQINLQPLGDKVFCRELASFMDLADKSGVQLTYAELLYAFGYWVFARQRVDYMVIETGLGGTLDATNVIDRRDKVCVITDLGLDHTNVLGLTLQEIANNKAGIITLRNAVFTYMQPQAAMREIRRASRQRQADLHIISAGRVSVPDDLPLFQQHNFGLAVAVTEYVAARDGLPHPSANQQLVTAKIKIPARMEYIKRGHQTIILDGAHNNQKLRALRKSIAAKHPGEPIAVMASFIKSGGRDITALMRELEPLYAHVIAACPSTKSKYRQWYDTAELRHAAEAAGLTSFEVIAGYKQATAALLRRPEHILVVTGSLYMHQYIRPLLVPPVDAPLA